MEETRDDDESKGKDRGKHGKDSDPTERHFRYRTLSLRFRLALVIRLFPESNASNHPRNALTCAGGSVRSRALPQPCAV